MLNETEPIGTDVGQDVINALFKQEIGRRIADEGLKINEGTSSSLLDLRTLLDTVHDDFVPVTSVKETSVELDDVIAAFDTRAKWTFNIPTLAEKVPGAGPGDFAIIFARPEVGKSAAWVSLVNGPAGFLEQGARVLVVVNEEPAIRSVARCISCYTGRTFDEIKRNPTEASSLWNRVKDRLFVIDDGTLTIEGLDVLCSRYKPDIIVVDQLDKLGISGTFAREDQKLLSLYVAARNIGKTSSAFVIGISQASADADDKAHVHFTMMDNSKTGKAAQADLIMGIGAHNTMGNEQSPTRYWTISKNKLNGWHGCVITLLDSRLSRYTA